MVIQTDGILKPCYQVKEYRGNIYKNIQFNNQLIRCPFDYCGCPLNVYDPYLIDRIKDNT